MEKQLVGLIKLQPRFFTMMLEGKKLHEFRKLSKGLKSGRYGFIDLTRFEADGLKWDAEQNEFINKNKEVVDIYDYVMGYADLEAFYLNPMITKCKGSCASQDPSGSGEWQACNAHEYLVDDDDEDSIEKTLYTVGFWYDHEELIDKDSYEFVKERYVDAKEDFIAYRISNVKAGKYE